VVMSRIDDLREPVRPIIEKFMGKGFTFTDITSVGLLLLKDWDANKMAIYRELLCKSGLDADAIVAEAEADSRDKKRKGPRPPAKSG